MTEQEEFWAGEFGDAYNARNQGPQLDAARLAMFSRILSKTTGIKSVTELGINTGGNLLAISDLIRGVKMCGVDVNAKAVEGARETLFHLMTDEVSLIHGSLFDTPLKYADLTMAVGVLIHIAPDMLPAAYARLYELSYRYILMAEYYSPKPEPIDYRGHKDRLWKRDFAGEFLDTYHNVSLVDYGFIYHRDTFPMDDVTWFLMEKRA